MGGLVVPGTWMRRRWTSRAPDARTPGNNAAHEPPFFTLAHRLLVAATLSTASGMGRLPGYWVFKPSAMLIAIVFVAATPYFTGLMGDFA